MARQNLSENEPVNDLKKAVRDLQTANPLNNGSVDRDGVLTVQAGGTLLGVLGSLLEWAGQTDFGYLNASIQLRVGTEENPARSYLNGGVTVNFGNTILNDSLIVNGHTTANGQVTVLGTTQLSNTTDKDPTYVNGNLTARGQVAMPGIPKQESSTGMRMVALNANNQLVAVPIPQPGTGGDDIGGGGDNPDGLVYPYPLSQAGSRWGPRRRPGGFGSSFHRGIDWPKAQGTRIPASGAGVVSFAAYTSGWGNRVIINHGGGVQTAYAHIMPGGFAVSVGQTVAQGQTIAYVGTTGPSTGPHLHFEVILNGTRINPEVYIG